VVDASLRWGPRAGLLVLAAAGGLGLVAETVGVHTGVPFGTYAYAGSLGPQVLGVPLLVPLAWTMTAYPALFLGRRLAGAARGRAVRVALLGGGALASWDLFLDPQMVAAGHWTWAFPEPGLPGVPGVPLTNYAGWVLVSVPMVALLDRLLPASGPGDVPSPRAEAVPAAVLAWTWLGSCVGNLVFFDRPAVALWGGLAMGVFVAPYLVALRRAARRTGRRG
jgi:putative membrane protein